MNSPDSGTELIRLGSQTVVSMKDFNDLLYTLKRTPPFNAPPDFYFDQSFKIKLLESLAFQKGVELLLKKSNVAIKNDYITMLADELAVQKMLVTWNFFEKLEKPKYQKSYRAAIDGLKKKLNMQENEPFFDQFKKDIVPFINEIGDTVDVQEGIVNDEALSKAVEQLVTRIVERSGTKR